MIAMALACRPSLVVADEPTTALDVMVQAQVLDVLSGLVKELGVGMMMISHDLSVLADVSDRIAVMYAGRVVEQGPADQVFTDPLHPYAAPSRRRSRGSVTRPRGYAPVRAAGDPPDPRELPPGCSFAPRCPLAVDECRAAEPPLAPKAPGRDAACIRVGEAAHDRRVGRTRRRSASRRAAWRSSSPTAAGEVATALDGADLTVRSGEIVALVGESGSGKTTLARTLTGLEPPTRGRGAGRRRAAGVRRRGRSRRSGGGCR